MGNSIFFKLFTEGSAFAFVNKQYKYLKRQNVLTTLEAVVGGKKSFGIFRQQQQICLYNDTYHIEQSGGAVLVFEY